MNTRFVFAAGVLVLGIAATAALVRTPRPSLVSSESSVEETDASPASPTSEKTVAATAKAPEFYGDNVGSGLFVRHASSPEASALAQADAPAPSSTLSDPPPTVAVHDPLAEYIYSGTVTIDGQKQALLENARTRQGWYLRPGENFMGATVKQIDDRMVTLNVHGQLRRIPKSTAYNVVPLNAQAGATGTAQSAFGKAQAGVTTERYGIESGNPNAFQNLALAFQNDAQAGGEQMILGRQMIADKVSQDVSQGVFQATLSIGDGATSVIFSTADPNNP